MLKNILNKKQICNICVQGLFKTGMNEEIPVYENILDNKIQKEFPIPMKDFESEICTFCMGINQLVLNDIFISSLLKHINSSQFEFKTFCFNFKLPLSLKLRQE